MKPWRSYIYLLLVLGSSIFVFCLTSKRIKSESPFRKLLDFSIKGDLMGVIQIINENPSVDINMDLHEVTPLLAATSENHYPVVLVLLAKGADPNKGTKSNFTPLMASSVWGYVAITDLLLQYNASIDARDVDGNTALLFACRNDNVKIVKKLLEKNADTNISNLEGLSPIILAVLKENVEMVALLLKHGADPNSKDKYGIPIIFSPCINNNKAIFKLLMDYGAKIDVQRKGVTLLRIAQKERYKEIEDLIINATTKSKPRREEDRAGASVEKVDH